MTKEDVQKRCEYCNKWFSTRRDGRFCSDRHRVKWHAAEKERKELAVYNGLRQALTLCVERHPELLTDVNEILTAAGDAAFSPRETRGT